MSDLKDFIIENGVLTKYIGSDADIFIPDGVVSIGRLYGEGVFDGCKKITSIRLNNGLTTIGINAFKSCAGIISIIIPNTVKEISSSAFDYCTKLETIEFMADCEAHILCTGCKALTYVKGTDFTVSYVLKGVSTNQKAKLCYGYLNTDDKNGEYEKNVKKLKNRLINMIVADDNGKSMLKFLNCYAKPLSIKEIDELLSLAVGSVAVTTVLLEYKAKNHSKASVDQNARDNEEKELGVKERSLSEWRKIFKLSIGKTEIAIGGYKSDDPVVVIPEHISGKPVTWLQDAFMNCDYITEVVMPDTVTAIGWSTFQDCTKLEKVTLSQNLEKISNFCFYGCSSLKELHIPASVTTIEEAFDKKCKPTIYAPIGSYAEQFAKKHRFKFVAE